VVLHSDWVCLCSRCLFVESKKVCLKQILQWAVKVQLVIHIKKAHSENQGGPINNIYSI